MRGRTIAAVVVGAALVGAATRCVPAFVCESDAQCDLGGGGRCEAGVCRYDLVATTGVAPPTEPGNTGPDDGMSSGGLTEASASETSETGEPAPCHKYDLPLADSGKATGVALAADGTAYVVGVTSTDPWELRVKRLSPTGEEVWSERVATIEFGGMSYADRDTDVWARVFLAGDELTVVHSQRMGMESEQDGVYVQTFAADDGTSRVTSTALVTADRSLRGAAAVNAGELLIAGETDENVWYQRVTRDGDAWSAEWPEPPGFSPAGAFFSPEIAQGIAVLPGGEAMVGGTWDHGLADTDNPFRGWLRRVSAGGGKACECRREGAGILALTRGSDGALYAGGFLQTPQDMGEPQAEWWLARTGCENDVCPVAWELHEPGPAAYTQFYRAEFVQDAIYALAPVGDGVLAGGNSDNRPLVVQIRGDKKELWRMPASSAAPKGAALALAVAEDERCVTIVGSVDYADYVDRKWWVRRIVLP